jgi:hypothetical protein
VTGPFGSAAAELHGLGLAPIPCPVDPANDDGAGKVPGVKWQQWRARPGLAVVRGMARRWPTANVGVLTGLSQVTVIDVDQAADLMHDMLARFGDTPLITTTPSSGVHLWFRAGGERCRNLRRSENLPVDVKAIGGLVVVPPSIRPSGVHAGGAYTFQRGSWADLTRLPRIRPGSLPDKTVRPKTATERSGSPLAHIGERNCQLFRMLLRQAPACDDFDAILDVATGLNEAFEPPLSDAEVKKTAASAWHYQETGRNFIARQGQRVFITAGELTTLASATRGADAALLLLTLRTRHFGRPVFAISPKAMVRDRLIANWASEKYRAAIALLMELKLLKIVRRGGRGAHDPTLYCFQNVLGESAAESRLAASAAE